jgi:hypothetical protein
MQSRRTLAITLSSIIGSLVALAASPALAITPIQAAQDLTNNILPADNAWGTPCSINWTSYTATTNGACLFSLSLIQANLSYTTQTIKGFWGSTNPGSALFYDKIVAGVHFTNITNIANIASGDLISIKYTSTTGASMMVDVAPVAWSPATAPLQTGTSQWIVGIIDSTTTPHGDTDSRWHADVDGAHDQGVGTGDMRLYTDATGAIVGYTWTLDNGSVYYDQATRQLGVGRFVP